ncbi:MAG: PAS domain-containing sensor histidine kinase [Methyloceanibacter sp.]|nr:PAS domain-containing sensor histidine kinase [Methyloceanibacter sp.]
MSAYFRSLVHESARGDALTFARHQTFIASRLLGGALALCIFPIYLVIGGKPSFLGAFAFLWLMSPIAIAIYLSRTGRFAVAHRISAVNFAGLVTYCAWLTGGLASPLLPWLVAVPFEAGLSTDRRSVAWALAAAATGLVTLAILGASGVEPLSLTLPIPPAAFAFLGAFSAMVYAAGLVVTLQLVHRQSEYAIEASEERYRLLAENANDMITLHDRRGRVVFASQAARQLLGATAPGVLGDGLFEHVHVADRPAFLSALNRCRANDEPMSVEFRLRRGGSGDNGYYAWVEMRCRPMPRGGSAEDSAVVAVTRDISQHKEYEAQLLRARGEAEGANHAKSQFLASMSHELRTPLNAIIGFSEILEQELFGKLGEARYREYARLIHESGGHLLGVVNGILDMSKIEAGKFTIVREPFAVGSLVESCCEILRHTAETKGLRLETEVADGLPELAADKRACKQMLLNVISNAVKFTEAGGRVTVAATTEGGNMVFSVTDDGIGIAEKDLPRLGKPFVQATSSYDRSYEGAGLGLSVVRGLAQLHGGSLTLDSTLGKGTKVRILLPLETEDEPIPNPSRQASAAAA